MRVLVTGSRDWGAPERGPGDEALLSAVLRVLPGGAVVVHGAQRSVKVVNGRKWFYGADTVADRVARDMGLAVDPHPADWEQFGRRAGPIRNQEMVDLGAVVCLGFPLEDSRGTWDCMIRAQREGIPVVMPAEEESWLEDLTSALG